MLRIELFYREDSLCDAWRAAFAGRPEVVITGDDICYARCDAIVSPANSFGFMDGGLDLALSQHFGWDLQTEVRRRIGELPERELVIGRSLVVPTGNATIPWLIVAPTMRVPMSFNIATSVNAYLAMKAVLIAALQHDEIRSVAVPGLCTGVGRMPASISAHQMVMAYDEVVVGRRPDIGDFAAAQRHQSELNPIGLIWDF